MAETLLSGYVQNIANITTATAASGVVVAAFSLAAADSYSFIIDPGTITGTSPTFDFEIEYSTDGGTTWYAWLRWAQITAVGARRITVQPIQGRGEAGTEAAITLHGSGALSANSPAPTGFGKVFQVYCTVGGTSPSMATLKVWVVAQIRQSAI